MDVETCLVKVYSPFGNFSQLVRDIGLFRGRNHVYVFLRSRGCKPERVLRVEDDLVRRVLDLLKVFDSPGYVVSKLSTRILRV